MDENKSPGQTPEQLLKMLELQIEMQRSQRQSRAQGMAGKRVAILLIGFVLLGGALLGTFLILQMRLSSAPTFQPSLARSVNSSRVH